MTVDSEVSFRSEEGDTLEHMVWRRYRRQDGRLVERALALNPGIEDLPPVLPEGTVVNLPLIEVESPVREVRLWG